MMARLRRGDAHLSTLMPSSDADSKAMPVDSNVSSSSSSSSSNITSTNTTTNATSAAVDAMSASATDAQVDEASDVGYECESVLRKRKRKMSKHKMQKRRWKERMNRREFGR
jgi:hypothetical protein